MDRIGTQRLEIQIGCIINASQRGGFLSTAHYKGTRGFQSGGPFRDFFINPPSHYLGTLEIFSTVGIIIAAAAAAAAGVVVVAVDTHPPTPASQHICLVYLTKRYTVQASSK